MFLGETMNKTIEKEKIENFDFDSFYRFISERFIGDDIIKILYVGLKASWKANVVPAFLLRGPPGAGKTMLTKIVAEFFNAHYVFIQTTLNTTEDELIYKYIPSETSRSGVKVIYGPLPEALVKSREKMTVLVVDEFDKTRPSADAMLLDYLQNARVSYRIDENEEIIEGNKNNLIVFITSNDMREFSEPLLRRVVVINFKVPDVKKVEQLLRKYFDDERIIKILITIYKAGLKAELSKPVTIQELVQLGNALQISPDADFNQLLYSFVVKNDEDFEKLTDAINELENESEEGEQEERLPNVADKIVEVINKNNNEEKNDEKKEEQKNTTTVQQIISKIKIPIEKIEKKIDNVDKINDTIEATFNMKIDEQTFYEYSEIVKRFEPEPADRPDILGKFKVVLDDSMRIISNEPLTLSEVYQLMNRSEMKFEAYIEDDVYMSLHDFIKLIRNREYLQIMYYTKNMVVAQHKENGQVKTLIRLENIKGKFHKIKLYINYDKNDNASSCQAGLVSDIISKYQVNTVLDGTIRWLDVEKMLKYEDDEQFEILKDFHNAGLLDRYKIIISNEVFKYNAKITFNCTEEKFIFNVAKERVDDYTIHVTVYNAEFATKIKSGKKEYDLKAEVNEIISRYTGTYNLFDGIIKLKQLYNELKEFYLKKIEEVVG